MKYNIPIVGAIIAVLLTLSVVACGCNDSQTNELATEALLQEETLSTAEASPPPTGDIITTASGLQYIEIDPGSGAKPQVGDVVAVHYTGTLEDGTVFDSSLDRGQPFEFTLGLGRVIPGWDEGIAKMKVGGKAKLIIPPELAYGDTARGNIPANSTLVFEVELLSVYHPGPPTYIDAADYMVSESGLKYYDLVEGEGPLPESGEVVVMHYAVWLQDGIPISNSRDGGQPLSVPLGSGQVFSGWEEGIATMKAGGKRQLVIPPELAFGDEGSGQAIPPNATLIMEVELLAIMAGAPAAPAGVDEADYTTTESGLKYYDFETGAGPSPETGQQVVVHYTGWLTDGTKFDSSLDRAQPFVFVIGQGQVIRGWDEGVATMKTGGRRQLVIPPELGYGQQGAGGVIPSNATLIFEVELLEIR